MWAVPERNAFVEDESETPVYRNYYECPDCRTNWEDDSDSMCNDRCPECDREIEPYDSEKP